MKLLLVLAILVSGCARLTVVRDENVAPAAVDKKNVKLHSFLWEIIPGKRIPPQQILCPSGRIERLDFGMDTGEVLLTLVTLGIYVPHHVDVTCTNQKN